MQSRKASHSKKTSKKANEASVSENTTAPEVKAKPRASRSSKSKQEVSLEAPSAKSHRKSALGAANIPASESSLVARTLPEVSDTLKTMSAAVGFESAPSSAAAIVDPVGVMAPSESSRESQYSREDVAKLAYFYWIARGYSHGAADEDWLRAEAELSSKL